MIKNIIKIKYSDFKNSLSILKKELKILYIKKIERQKSYNNFAAWLLIIFTIISFPIILLFGLLIMILAGLLSLWQSGMARAV